MTVCLQRADFTLWEYSAVAYQVCATLHVVKYTHIVDIFVFIMLEQLTVILIMVKSYKLLGIKLDSIILMHREII